MAGPKTPDSPARCTPAQRRKKDGELLLNRTSPRNVEGQPPSATARSDSTHASTLLSALSLSKGRPEPVEGPSGESRRVSGEGSGGPTRQQCGECLGAVAHRLSQPLTALRGSLELALRTELSPQDSRAALEQAFELTELVVQLMRSLRELAEAARADAPTKLLSLRDLVQETVEELQGLADSREIKTVFKTSHEAIVSAPPDRLREVVAKLLWLVIQRSPDRGDIGLAVSAGAASVGLLIADQGPSPGPGEFDCASGGTAGLGHLFAEAAKNRCLDWSIVRVLAESLGGTLEVIPRKSQGCCFILQLPLASPLE